MKKILISIFLLILAVCLVGCGDTPGGDDPGKEQPGKEQPGEIVVKNGTEVAKILLANERLDQSVFEDSNKIFLSGKESFDNIAKLTRLSMTKMAKRKGETYTEVDGDTYKWYNDVDYSNFMSYFESYAINIEFTAERAVRMIEHTKKYIRVVNSWVNIGGEEILLIVNENSEIIFTRVDGNVDVCKRYTDENGRSVYEMAMISGSNVTRMKYIPDLVYEFSSTSLNNSNGFNHYLIGDKSKGYWTILSFNGISSFELNGEMVEYCSMQSMVMKEEATYILDYFSSNYTDNYIGDIKIVSSDGKSDLVSFSQNRILLFNTGVYGLDHIEITAPKDKVGGFDPDIMNSLYVYEQDNVNNKGERYKIYSTSGMKSATAVCENGVSFTENDTLLNGKVQVGRVDVAYTAGCDSYGTMPFITNSSSYSEQIEILKELLAYTGFTFRRDYDEVIKCIEFSINDAQNFPKYYKLNGYHVNDFEQLKKGIKIETEKYKDLVNVYEQVKNIEVIDINNQEEYDSRIYFTDLEVVNQGTINNEGFSISIENFEVKVKDTLLFVEGEEYQVVFGLITEDGNIIPFTSEEDAKFVYKKGEDFILSLSKQINFDIYNEGEYVLYAYVCLSGENIRISKFTSVYGDIEEVSITQQGFKNELKNDSEKRIVISSVKDYNVYSNVNGDYTFEQLQEMLAQLAYDHGMFDEIIVEKLVEENWVIYEVEAESDSIENNNDNTSSDVNEESSEGIESDEQQELQESLEGEVVYVEKGQYRMKYIAQTDLEEDFYVYVTIK